MAETTLRDQLTAAIESAPEIEPAAAPASEEGATAATTEAQAAAAPVAGQSRDASGRFARGEGAAAAVASAAPASTAASQAPAAGASQAAPIEARRAPTTWKKDHWESFSKLDPGLQDYIEQREREFAKGVSTYRQEAEAARELHTALAPFQQAFQQHGMTPSQWIADAGRVHSTLAFGSPQDRMAIAQQLISQYQIPVQLAVQGQNGQWQLLPPQQRMQPQAAQQQRPVDVRSVVRQELEDERISSEVRAMMDDSTNYPHFKEVVGSMRGLLSAGLAQDLKSAYDAALRLPAHAELAQAMQEQQRKDTLAQQQAAQAATVARARANAVSPRTATPSANMASSGKKGLREQLSEAVEAVAGGRV